MQCWNNWVLRRYCLCFVSNSIITVALSCRLRCRHRYQIRLVKPTDSYKTTSMVLCCRIAVICSNSSWGMKSVCFFPVPVVLLTVIVPIVLETLKIAVVWVVTPYCSLVQVYRRFGGACWFIIRAIALPLKISHSFHVGIVYEGYELGAFSWFVILKEALFTAYFVYEWV